MDGCAERLISVSLPPPPPNPANGPSAPSFDFRLNPANLVFDKFTGPLIVQFIHRTHDGQVDADGAALQLRPGRKHHTDSGQKPFEIADGHALGIQLHVNFRGLGSCIEVPGKC